MLFKKKLVQAPLNYWEEYSYMMVITANSASNYLKNAIKNISKIDGVKVKDEKFDVERGIINLKLNYLDKEYDIGLYPGGISVPEFYFNNNFQFSDSDKEKILNANESITIFMKYNSDYDVCYHLQLKIAFCVAPDMVGLLDESAEKLLPAKWVIHTANTKTLPNPKALFNVHAVCGDNDKVWLHTHGLCRCGISELEVLESDSKNSKNHYNLISTYAVYLLDKHKKKEKEDNGSYIGRLINGLPVVVTSVNWTEGINEYKKLDLGGVKDRKNGHNTSSNVIFLYTSEEDEKNHKLSKVSIYDSLWGDNPIFFISDEETLRMKMLAMETFSYINKAFKNKDNQILIKVGLPVNEEEGLGDFEHIWFELLDIKGKKFKAKLTQEPYGKCDIHTGDEANFTVDDVTDWIIYTKKYAVTPNDVYLLDDESNK